MSYVATAAGVMGIAVGANTLLGNPLGLGGGGQTGQQAQQMVDPFAQYRQSYGALLNQFMGLGVGGPTGGMGGGTQPPVTSNPFVSARMPALVGVRGHRSNFHSLSAILAARSAQNQNIPISPTASTPAPATPTITPQFGQNDPAYQAALQQGMQAVTRANPGASGNQMLALQNFGMGYENQFNNQMFERLAMLSGASQGPAAGGQAGLNAENLYAQNQSQALGSIMSGAQALGKNWGTSTSMNTPVDNMSQYASPGGFAPSGGMAPSM